MPRRPTRLRWWLRIVFLTIFLLVGTTLIWSRMEPVEINQHFMAAWFGDKFFAVIDFATVRVGYVGNPPSRFAGMVPGYTPEERWGPVTFQRTGWGSWFLAISLKLPFIALGFITALFWLPSRRTPAGLCPNCRYNLRGLSESAPCPECGEEPRPKPQ